MAMILTNATLATMTGGYGLIADGALVMDGGGILWAGPAADLPRADLPVQDLGGRLVTPALIDCHTHLVFAGDRAQEFEMRLNGASYAEVARAGGGIASTVRATRAAQEEARRLGRARDVTVRTTFLGAHAIPPEFAGRADDYLTEAALPALRAAHAEGLVDAVDAFCEGIAFSPAQVARVFAAAHSLGLPVKLHAEQLSNLGGAALAARHGALSADHLEYLDEDGVRTMAAAGTVAVILPGAFYTLRETQVPPVGLLRRHGVPMAVATDCNPGSSPMTSLTLAMNMACTLFRMTPQEALLGTTAHAARALGLSDRGRIAAGQRADLAVWDAAHPAELSYRIGATRLHCRITGGRIDA